ncbi:cyanophycinase [Planktotalea arctica]|uniref:cyanophycinase n=2 Tax=Planktotalea arctica TaxID=1481893 RepID=UPI000A175C52|nr:cyanophycinase [Planktotalea arctica]
MCPAQPTKTMQRGWIIPIGGGDKKVRSSTILQRFVELSGGADARMVIIPTASQLDTAGQRTQDVFGQLGVSDIEIVDLATRADCADPKFLEKLNAATGIFFTGGNQLRLATTIGGTLAAKALRAANARGVHIAGTSAGAAFVCEHMIAIGKSGGTPKRGMASLSPGLGLTNRVIVDQHFRERDRLGRLMTALAYNPFATGVGVDEDTAAFIGPDDVIEVFGSGGLTIVDPSELEFSSMADAQTGAAVGLIGLKLHILLAGDRYDLNTRRAFPSAGP